MTYDFNDGDDMTYDTDKIEVSGGKAYLKDQRPANAKFYTNYETVGDADANWGAGTLTGSLGGAATVSGGKLNLVGNAYCDYNPDNFTALTTKGCLRFRCSPNFSGEATSYQYLCQFGLPSSLNNRILIFLYGNVVHGLIYDNNGNAIKDITSPFVATAGEVYEIEYNFDTELGQYRLFADGVLIASDLTTVGVRSNDITTVRFGHESNQDFSILDAIVFDTVQHVADYTPDWSTIPSTVYSTDNDHLCLCTTFRSDGINTFTASETKTGSDEIKYGISKDNIPYYWTGSAWAIGDGTYAQCTTLTDVSANISTLIAEGDFATIRIGVLFHSDDGSTTPEIESITVNFDYHGEAASELEYCTVYGYLFDAEGNPYTTAFRVYLDHDFVQYKTNVTLKRTFLSVTPDSTTGYWEAVLVENENMTPTTKYIFEFHDGYNKKTVPNQDTAEYYTLT
jgi:hypothetical protein